MLKLEFNKYSSKDSLNYIIILSNLNELKSIKNIPFNPDDLLKKQNLQSVIANISNSDFLINSSISNKLINIKILLLKNPKKEDCIKIGSNIYSGLISKKLKEVDVIFSNNLIAKNNFSCCELIFGVLNRSYTFNKFKQKSEKEKEVVFRIINQKIKFKKINYFENLFKGICFCKDLISEPANILNPITYANRCKNLKIPGLKIKVLNLQQIKKIGMNALLGVSQGSINQPRVVIFEWNIKKNKRPIALVGKGVTFDTGGISLKPSSGMEEMITDMSGSAVVVGSIINAALNKINKPLIGIIGLVENMPDGNAQRPGDIVKSLSGQTIEVLNTDAEGRLVLADILTYVQRTYDPKEIIDFATLTGAIMVALGTHKAGLFCNNDRLANKLFKSGEKTNENIWRLPLGKDYDNDINSSRADMQNIGIRWGGSITAAQFIKRFIENNTPWAHLDIAGVSWTKKGGKEGYSAIHSSGATAFGIRLIDQFLRD